MHRTLSKTFAMQGYAVIAMLVDDLGELINLAGALSGFEFQNPG
ncbi:MAG: hypothetical protein ABSH41_09355 [Syntrophobacteraceae bacterium]|jgi:hypothetical protein